MSKIIPLFSGSKGNSYYIESGGGGILIDAGRSCKQLETALYDNSIAPQSIEAVFVTHEHSDHCTALKVFASRYKTLVYATAGTLLMLEKADRLGNFKAEVITSKICLSCMMVERIDTMHDAAESCCYRVTARDGRSVTVATDLGMMTDEIRRAISQSDVAVIESNHDVNMLKNGRYPYELKRRILSETGHLSNNDCACELADFVRSNTTRFILGHLSKENNTPELAYQTSLCALSMQNMRAGVDFTLDVAPEICSGECLVF